MDFLIILFIITMWIVPFLIVFYFIRQQRTQVGAEPRHLNFDVHFWVWVQREQDEEKEEEKQDEEQDEEKKFDFEYGNEKPKIT